MLASKEIAIRDLKALFGHSTPDKIRLGMILATTHSARLAHLEAAVDWITQEHSKTRQHRLKRNEDALTIDIVTDLKALGFDASHDVDYGGHCDIVVEGRDNFLWIAEAKIHKNYAWLLKGFQQLDTRYSTGIVGQNAGGMIIYCKGPRVDQIMERWKKYLSEGRSDVTVEQCPRNPLAFRSTHVHERTGLPFFVRHVPVSLYFAPKDS